MPLNTKDFAAKIKAKYPEYADVDDTELSRKIVDKYPEYKDKVSFEPVAAPIDMPRHAPVSNYNPDKPFSAPTPKNIPPSIKAISGTVKPPTQGAEFNYSQMRDLVPMDKPFDDTASVVNKYGYPKPPELRAPTLVEARQPATELQIRARTYADDLAQEGVIRGIEKKDLSLTNRAARAVAGTAAQTIGVGGGQVLQMSGKGYKNLAAIMGDNETLNLIGKYASKSGETTSEIGRDIVTKLAYDNPGNFEKVVSAFTSGATFFIPGLAVSKVAQAMSYAPALATAFGISASSFMESGLEAGMAREEAINAGYGEDKADQIAKKVFLTNIPITTLGNKLGIFAKANSIPGKFAQAYLAEGTQEAMQEIAPNLAFGKRPMANVGESFALGGLVGGVMGVGESLGNRPGQPAPAVIPEVTAPPVAPQPGSYEANVVEFKVRQAIGVKPLTPLTPELLQAAWDEGKLPQALGVQIGFAPAVQAYEADRADLAAAKAETEAATQAVGAESDAVIRQALAEMGIEQANQAEVEAAKVKTEQLTAPHPVARKPVIAMSEDEFTAQARAADPEADGAEIKQAYSTAMTEAKDLKLTDDAEIERLNADEPVLEAEEPDITFDATEPAPGVTQLHAMTLEQAQAKFPGLTEAQHKQIVKQAVDTYQLAPKDAPYEDIAAYGEEKIKTEQSEQYVTDELERQMQEKGHITPVLNMLFKSKLNRKRSKDFMGGELDTAELRGYFTDNGGMSPAEAAERAWVNGWLPDGDENTLFDAIDKELRLRAAVKETGKRAAVGFLETPEIYAPAGMPSELADLLGLTPAQRYAQSAWHGSPYDFDQFLLHKIGTGEGAQAYGYGLYFAGDKEVAEYYKGKLSEPKIEFTNKVPVTPEELSVAETINKEVGVMQYEARCEEARKVWKRIIFSGESFRNYLGSPNYPNLTEADVVKGENTAKAARELGEPKVSDTGKLYEVNIPDSDKMLDWDKPLSKQPEPVQKAIEKIWNYVKKGNENKNYKGDLSGREIYRLLEEAHGIPEQFGGLKKKQEPNSRAEESSRLLNSVGIIGIKYLDGTSRSAGEGNHNYVVFDDKLISIINKYSEKPAGHIYQPGEHLRSEAEAFPTSPEAANQQSVADTRKVAPVGQWHDLRKDPVINRISLQTIKDGFASVIGQVIETVQDVAEIAAFVRHPLIEHFSVVKIKDGKVTGSLVLTSGKVGFVDPSMAEIQSFVADADEFYACHNHPSGNATPSTEDIESTKLMASDKRFKGHVVTDHQTYTAIHPDGTAIAQEFKGEKVSFRRDIEKMAVAPAVVGWARGNLQGDNLGIMFVDSQLQVMSFDQVSPTSNYNLYIKRHAEKYGATGVFLVAGEGAYAKMTPRQLNGAYHDMIVLNADGSYQSAAKGWVKGFNVPGKYQGIENHYEAAPFAETPAEYDPGDYNKMVGRYKPGMKLTLRNRYVSNEFLKGLPRGTEGKLVSVDPANGDMLVEVNGAILTMTPNLFKETYRQPGAPQEGQKRLSWPDTVRGLEKTPREVKDAIDNGKLNYDVMHHEDTLAEAKALLEADFNKAYQLVFNTTRPTRVTNTVAGLIMDKLQREQNWAANTALMEHTARINKDAGQAIEALKIYMRLTPEGILRYASGMVKKAQDNLGKDKPGGESKLITELRALTTDAERVAFAAKHNLPYMSVDASKEILGMANDIKGMEPGFLRNLKTAIMLRKVSEMRPRDMWDKISGFQLLAQLLNPKTFIRNVVGNTVFMAFENFSQAVSVPLDAVTSVLSGKRTVAMFNLKVQAQGFAKGWSEGWQEAWEGVDTRDMNNKYDLPRGFIYDNKVLRFAEKLLNVSLRATDRAFYQAAFNDSLHGQMKLAKVTEPDDLMLEIAHLDGLYRTFNDANALRTAMSALKTKVLNAGQKWGLGDMIIKYPGTPSSIVMRGIEYSPVNLVQVSWNLINDARKHEFNQREFVQASSRAITGTTFLVGTGFILSALGLIRGKDDDKKTVRATEAAAGIKDYQINIDGIMRFLASGLNPEAAARKVGDRMMSYDWLQPAAIGLSMGANVHRALTNGETSWVADTLQAAGGTIEQQPMLQGVSRAFRYNEPVKAVTETLQGIPASFVPTLLNQVRQLGDNTARDVESDEPFYSPTGKMANMVRLKIPGLSGTLPPRVDILGRIRQNYQNDSNNPFNVFLNPAFVAKYDPTPTTELVLDIWARSGETIQIPRLAPPDIKVRGVKRPLTQYEQAEFQHQIGVRTSNVFSRKSNDPEFMALPDRVKAKILQGILTDIHNITKYKVLGVRE